MTNVKKLFEGRAAKVTAAGAALSSNVSTNKTRIDELETENATLKQRIEEIAAGGVSSSIYIKDCSE